MTKLKGNDYDKLMRAARKRVSEMDEVDGGCATVLPVFMTVRTIMSALECAISMGDWGVACDAQVMLSQLELRIRPGVANDGQFYLQEKPK